MMKVKRTERGWQGHFIGECCYHRNTLLEYGKRKWVISTIGRYTDYSKKIMPVGSFNRFYETMCFVADDTPYHEIIVSKSIKFESEWGLWGDMDDDSWEDFLKIHSKPDVEADKLHEKVVVEMMRKIRKEKK